MRQRIGFVAQSSGTYDRSTARRDLVHQARMYGVSKSAAKGLAEAAIKAFQLGDFADRHIGTYSGGQRRRLDVALGVIHSPQVIFLDEPTAGLDPPSRARMWQEVRRLRDQGMTIFLTTHYLDEADALCDRISIIDAGLIVAEGTPSDLKREISGDVIIVDLAAPDTAGAPEPTVMLEGAKILTEQPYVHSCETIDAHPAPLRGQRRHRHPAGHAGAEQQGDRAGSDRVPPAEPRRRVPGQDRPHSCRLTGEEEGGRQQL